MNYEALVPSRELCEELARLGICQDGAELRWVYKTEGWIVTGIFHGNAVIAPTLPRMFEELPDRYNGGWLNIQKYSDINKCDIWTILYLDEEEFIQLKVYDNYLPNAVSRALIAFKEAK